MYHPYPLLYTPPPPLISASHPFFFLPSTDTPLTMLVFSYPSQAQQPHDGILVAKYVQVEYLYHHLIHYYTPHIPLDLCLTSILLSPHHWHTLYYASIVVPFASTAATCWHICSQVREGEITVPSPYPPMYTPKTPWSLPHIHFTFATALTHPLPCYNCRTLVRHISHRMAYWLQSMLS